MVLVRAGWVDGLTTLIPRAATTEGKERLEYSKPELRITVTVFFELRHQVAVGGNLGPLHKHSCSMEVELIPPEDNTIPFADLEAEVKAQISPFDGRALNELANFRKVNPSVENLAFHVYHRLLAILPEYGAGLCSVLIRESPVRSVKVMNTPQTGVVVSTTGVTTEGSPFAPPVGLPRATRMTTTVQAEPPDQRSPYGDVPPSPGQRPSSDFNGTPEELPPTTGTSSSRQEVPPSLDGPPPDTPFGEAAPSTPPSLPLPAPAAGPLAAAHGEVRLPREPAGPEFPSRRRRKILMRLMPSGSGDYDPLAIPPRHLERRKTAPRWRRLLWGAVLALLGAVVYHRILWPPVSEQYPWGSDTWAHIAKAQFLKGEMAKGHLFPLFNPAWYNGVEPFRYWAPLPYYLLAAIMAALADPFRAAGAYVAVCAVIGALGWLPHRRRLGTGGALIAAVLWMSWPDHVRVAMSEGNLPRAMATALFPFALHWFLNVLEREDWPRSAFVLIGIDALLVLTHAMIAAGFFVIETLLAVIWTVVGGLRAEDVGRGLAVTFAGIAASGWWLLPALRSGIVSVDAAAVTAAIDYFPVSKSFNPLLRLSNPEVFYWGLALVPAALWVLVTWRQRHGLSRAALVAGLLIVAATTPALRPLYNSLPLHHLLWPVYLASAAPAMFFIALLRPLSGRPPGGRRAAVYILVALIALLVADAYPTLRLISTRPKPTVVERAVRELPPGGWREATLDLSGFGSTAAYLVGAEGQREQVFGWAWQGATTSQNIVWINRALKDRHWTFMFNELRELGATHLVVRRDLVTSRLDEFLAAAAHLGYKETWRSSEALVLATDTPGPYALLSDYQGLAIGRYASNLAMIFPTLEVGSDPYVDSYTPAVLARYRTVVVSGALWRSKAKAEEVLRQYALGGGRLVVDLQGLPEDTFSRRPSLFGVVGEPVNLYQPLTVYSDQTASTTGSGSGVATGIGAGSTPVSGATGAPGLSLSPFDSTYDPWKGLSPQNLSSTSLHFLHLGERTALVGAKDIGGKEVFFVGANLPFHAFLTGDPAATGILADLLGLKADAAPAAAVLPLDGYTATSQGYSFALTVPDNVSTRTVTVPVAYRNNMTVEAGGTPVPVKEREHLMTLTLPPGHVTVTVRPVVPHETLVGGLVSVVALAASIWLVVRSRRRKGGVGLAKGAAGRHAPGSASGMLGAGPI